MAAADDAGSHGLFVEGGFLFDLALFNECPSAGRRRSNRRNGASRSRNRERMKSTGAAIGYLYPEVTPPIYGSERVNDFEAYLDKEPVIEYRNFEYLDHCVSDDDGYSCRSYDNKLNKLGGINLMVASMEYGMKKKYYKPTPVNHDTLDDIMLGKDPSSVPGRIRNVAGIPQFWPSEPCRRKRVWKIPWKKRRQRKVKRGGLNLRKINLKLEEMVLDGTRDDCSQSQLIGGDEALKPEKCTRRNGSRKNLAKKEVKKSKDGKVGSYASRPHTLSFIPRGTMEDDILELKSIKPNDNGGTIDSVSDAQGAFEMHTSGFGSKMMAKMGYVEGQGLGKNCQGMAQPIQVVQRPKSLGLGAKFTKQTQANSSKLEL